MSSVAGTCPFRHREVDICDAPTLEICHSPEWPAMVAPDVLQWDDKKEGDSRCLLETEPETSSAEERARSLSENWIQFCLVSKRGRFTGRVRKRLF